MSVFFYAPYLLIGFLGLNILSFWARDASGPTRKKRMFVVYSCSAVFAVFFAVIYFVFELIPLLSRSGAS